MMMTRCRTTHLHDVVVVVFVVVDDAVVVNVVVSGFVVQ